MKHTSTLNLQTATVTQAIGFTFLNALGYDGFKAHTEAVSKYYEQKRDDFEAAMKRHLSDLAEWSTPEAGMFLWCVNRSP